MAEQEGTGLMAVSSFDIVRKFALHNRLIFTELSFRYLDVEKLNAMPDHELLRMNRVGRRNLARLRSFFAEYLSAQAREKDEADARSSESLERMKQQQDALDRYLARKP